MIVFISYSHSESQLVEQIARAFTDAGIKYFRDAEHIELGAQLAGSVGEALHNCDVILVVVSSSSLRSHWVPYEIGRAIALRKPLIPYVVDLPTDIPQYIRDVRYATTIEELVQFIHSGGPKAPSPKPFPSERKYLTRETTAFDVLSKLFEKSGYVDRVFEQYFKERWVSALGGGEWICKLTEDPFLISNNRWLCNLREASKWGLHMTIYAETTDDVVDLRESDNAVFRVEGKISRYSTTNNLWRNIHLDEATLTPL